MSDAAVLAASLTDPDRFGEVYDRHHVTVFRYVRSRIGSDQLDDVVADAFVAAFRARDRFEPELGASCLPWLLGIATHVIARRRGAERRWLRALATPAPRDTSSDAFDDADERMMATTLSPWLSEALAALRRRDREALLLHVAGDLSVAEVAIALGVAPGTVKSRLHRARRILAANLEVRR